MAFNVNEFKAQVNKHGLAVNNLFVVTISPPKNYADGVNPRDLTFFCKSVGLPDNQMNVVETKPYGYGPGISYPTYMPNGALATVFYVDHKMEVMKFFHRWQQNIYNYDFSNGILAENEQQVTYELNYKSEYAATITVDIYSAHHKDMKYTYTFYGAYPATVSNGQFAWENGAEFHSLPVQFKYSHVTNSGLQNAGLGSAGGNFDYTSALGSVGQLVDNINNAASTLSSIAKIPEQFNKAVSDASGTIKNVFRF